MTNANIMTTAKLVAARQVKTKPTNKVRCLVLQVERRTTKAGAKDLLRCLGLKATKANATNVPQKVRQNAKAIRRKPAKRLCLRLYEGNITYTNPNRRDPADRYVL